VGRPEMLNDNLSTPRVAESGFNPTYESSEFVHLLSSGQGLIQLWTACCRS